MRPPASPPSSSPRSESRSTWMAARQKWPSSLGGRTTARRPRSGRGTPAPRWAGGAGQRSHAPSSADGAEVSGGGRGRGGLRTHQRISGAASTSHSPVTGSEPTSFRCSPKPACTPPQLPCQGAPGPEHVAGLRCAAQAEAHHVVHAEVHGDGLSPAGRRIGVLAAGEVDTLPAHRCAGDVALCLHPRACAACTGGVARAVGLAHSLCVTRAIQELPCRQIMDART